MPSPPEIAVLSWSGGKDSALALDAALADPALRVAGLLTTVTDGYDRVSMHGVRRSLLEAQAAALGLPLSVVRIPARATNEAYEQATLEALARCHASGVSRVLFGDLFLEDVRRYRERLVARAGLACGFPLWGRDTRALAAEFVRRGFRATLVCVDPRQVPATLCGCAYDEALLAALPPGADPCGENGEFHTFVHDGPRFARPVPVRPAEVVERDGFWFCELRDAAGPPTTAQ
jgi:uncharacterized protein (TIGR00290 family)